METTGWLSGQKDPFSWGSQLVLVKEIIWVLTEMHSITLEKALWDLSSESAPVWTSSFSNTSSASNLLYLLLLQQSPGLLWHPCALLGWIIPPADLGHGTRTKSTRQYVKETAQRQLITSHYKRETCTSELGGLDLKFTLKVNVIGTWVARALWGKAVHQDEQIQKKVSRLISMTAQNTNPKCISYSSCSANSAMVRLRFLERVTFRALLGQPSPDTQLWIHGKVSIGSVSLQQAGLLFASISPSPLLQCRPLFAVPDPCFTCSPWRLRSGVLISASGKGNSLFGEIWAKMKTSSLSFITLVKHTTQHR